MSSITYITGWLGSIHNENYGETLIHFCRLAASGINICIFVCDEYEQLLRDAMQVFPNTKIMATRNPIHMWSAQEVAKRNGSIELPDTRNTDKDTYEYLLMGHAKHELIEYIVAHDPFNSTHFAWIDFNIMNMFKDTEASIAYFKWMSSLNFQSPFITFPGCWPKLDNQKYEDILNAVHWRFCGAFILGDKASMREFVELYKEAFPQFLDEYKKLVWDFNFWAYMETKYEDRWKPLWYRADHNDSILHTTADIYTPIVKNIKTAIYAYPDIDKYLPTSASYLYTGGRHYLNTRYVNYWIYPNGSYHFNSGRKLIENKNMLSELNEDTYEPIYYKEASEQVGLPVDENSFSQGLEDIRLYEVGGKVKYVATTAGYSGIEGKVRIIVGEYDLESGVIGKGAVVESPTPDTWCEKNWIPIVKRNPMMLGDGTIIEREEEMFIYKWSPLEIGKIANDSEGKLRLDIVEKHNVPTTLFSRVRGSTIFEEVEDGMMGVVHFSEDHSPRHYYHMLVLLDKKTYQIIKYSQTFCFEKLGIEFCIGFTVDDDKYVFWISRHDKDPMMVWVDYDEIKWV